MLLRTWDQEVIRSSHYIYSVCNNGRRWPCKLSQFSAQELPSKSCSILVFDTLPFSRQTGLLSKQARQSWNQNERLPDLSRHSITRYNKIPINCLIETYFRLSKYVFHMSLKQEHSVWTLLHFYFSSKNNFSKFISNSRSIKKETALFIRPANLDFSLIVAKSRFA